MRKILLILLLGFTANNLVAQLCGKSGTVAGGFTFDGPSSGCPPFTVKLKDISGGTNVQYVYIYNGEDASKLSSLSPDNKGTFDYILPGTYTILQYGKKGGSDMYFCTTVTVFDSPTFTYNSCNRNAIKLTIPTTAANNFDYYSIDWGDSQSENTANGQATPIVKSHPYSSYADFRAVTLKGYKAGVTSGCIFSLNVDLRGGGSDFPIISRIELSTDGTQANLQLKGGSSTKYTLHQRLSSSFQTGAVHATDVSYPSTGTLIVAGTNQVSIPDPTKSYCFVVRTPGTACGIAQSNELCTIPLDISTPNSTTNHLEWGKHFTLTVSDPTSDFGQAVLPNSTVTIYKEEVGGASTTIPRMGQTYDDVIDCSKVYCYQIEQKVSGETSNLEVHYSKSDPLVSAVTLSQKKCIDRKTIKAPAIDVGVVTVNDKNYVEGTWTDNVVWQPQKKKYVFWRADSQTGTFTKIDEITPPLTTYTDTKIDASQKQYCYEVTFEDECGSSSKPSSPLCSVFLDENNNSLKWTAEQPFDLALNHYEVEYQDEPTKVYKPDGSQTTTSFSPDLSKFEEFAVYRIKAISNTSGEISYSNVFTIPIKASMLFPEAFTPNNDGKNDTFAPVGRLNRIKIFTLTIYNRWGNVVYLVNDKNKAWDGNLSNGEKAPVDIYTFKADGILDDGTTVTRFGKVLLLR